MPIVRTYACPACNFMIEVTLDMSQWDEAPPICPECQRREMQQDFRPVAIGGSNHTKAVDLAHTIASEDYHVADMQREPRREGTPTVRYTDQTPGPSDSTWTAAQDTIAGAIAEGRKTRLQYGSGLDILQANLKSGKEPDLIEASKRRMIKVW